MKIKIKMVTKLGRKVGIKEDLEIGDDEEE